MSDPVTWGDVLRERRSQLGLTQRQLAAAAGVAEKTITNTETGGMTPKPKNLLAICDALGLTDELAVAINEVVAQRTGLAAMLSAPSIWVTDPTGEEAQEPVTWGHMEGRLAEIEARIGRLERIALRAAGGSRLTEADGPEVVADAMADLDRLGDELAQRRVRREVPSDLPGILTDEDLIGQPSVAEPVRNDVEGDEEPEGP